MIETPGGILDRHLTEPLEQSNRTTSANGRVGPRNRICRAVYRELCRGSPKRAPVMRRASCRLPRKLIGVAVGSGLRRSLRKFAYDNGLLRKLANRLVPTPHYVSTPSRGRVWLRPRRRG